MTVDRRVAPLPVDAQHPAYAGHFPEFPILPGAVLLDEALREIAQARSIDLSRWQLSSAKFLEPVRPGDLLELDHATDPSGTIRFRVSAGDRAVLSGVLTILGAGT